ncbi:MAG: GlxA family transcriptional regulator [Parvibaculaceae bacterium]
MLAGRQLLLPGGAARCCRSQVRSLPESFHIVLMASNGTAQIRFAAGELNDVADAMILPERHGTASNASDDDLQRFVSKGAAFHALDADIARRDFYFLMLPKMTMLAFAAAVEPLRIANQLTGKCLYRWFLLSADGLPVRCSNGVSIAVDLALTGTRRDDTVFVCSGVDGYLAATRKTIAWIREQAHHGRTIGGLCTGAFSLARAGLLAGRRFTLHWENQPAFEELFPHLPIEKQLYCRDGAIITCGGGDAGVDMMVSLIEEHYGAALSAKVAAMCLHGGPRVGSSSQRVSTAAETGVRHPALVHVLQRMKTDFTEEIDIEGLAAASGLSRRQLERLFQKNFGVSPGETLRRIRLEHANSLMTETNMSITEIAVASGFRSANKLRIAYRQKFGIAPTCRFPRSAARKTS